MRWLRGPWNVIRELFLSGKEDRKANGLPGVKDNSLVT